MDRNETFPINRKEFKMNTKLVLAMLMAFCVVPEIDIRLNSLSDSEGWTICCSPPWGGQYASTITPKMRDSAPDWVETELNPPLSAREAIRLAETTLCAMSKREIDPLLERSLVCVTLMPLMDKKWCWKVSYEWHARVGGETGTPYDFQVLVLMNGKVILPEKRKWNGAEIEMNKCDQEKKETPELRRDKIHIP
jgi:hypothetical protein